MIYNDISVCYFNMHSFARQWSSHFHLHKLNAFIIIQNHPLFHIQTDYCHCLLHHNVFPDITSKLHFKIYKAMTRIPTSAKVGAGFAFGALVTPITGSSHTGWYPGCSARPKGSVLLRMPTVASQSMFWRLPEEMPDSTDSQVFAALIRVP